MWRVSAWVRVVRVGTWGDGNSGFSFESGALVHFLLCYFYFSCTSYSLSYSFSKFLSSFISSVSVSGLAATKYPDYTTYPQADRNLMACISRVCYFLQPVTALIIQCFWLLHYVAQNVWGILMRGLGNGFVYLFSLIIFWGKVQNWEHWPKMLHLCLHKEAWQIVSSLMFLCLCDFFWPRGHSSLWQNCK